MTHQPLILASVNGRLVFYDDPGSFNVYITAGRIHLIASSPSWHNGLGFRMCLRCLIKDVDPVSSALLATLPFITRTIAFIC